MINVKLSMCSLESILPRQTPGMKCAWGDYQFHINTPATDFDYWVIHDNILEQGVTARCPKGCKVLVTGEPPNIYTYPNGFLRQFDHVLTMDTQICHPGRVASQPAIEWNVGFSRDDSGKSQINLTYDDFSNMNQIPKNKLISVVTSSKTMCAGHRQRLKFIQILREAMGEELEVFGRGVRYVADKWDAMAPYQYHIALENGVYPDYVSEKIGDAFLAMSYPFYYGAPNLTDYFPAASFTPIDIYKPQQAVAIIKEGIANNLQLTRQKALKEARDRVLNKINFFAHMTAFLSNLPCNGPLVESTLRARQHFPADWTIRRIARLPASLARYSLGWWKRSPSVIV